eukprot:6053068-Prorocentrum_lima.AAC.1
MVSILRLWRGVQIWHIFTLPRYCTESCALGLHSSFGVSAHRQNALAPRMRHLIVVGKSPMD